MVQEPIIAAGLLMVSVWERVILGGGNQMKNPSVQTPLLQIISKLLEAENLPTEKTKGKWTPSALSSFIS